LALSHWGYGAGGLGGRVERRRELELGWMRRRRSGGGRACCRRGGRWR